jgi:hypothetical protein
MKKMFLIGLALVVAFALAFSYYSQQVTAQQPPPVKGVKPQFATIQLDKNGIKSVNGKESVVMLFTEQQKNQFLAEYKNTKTTAPLVLEVTFSPTQTYYALVCRVTGGKMICQ